MQTRGDRIRHVRKNVYGLTQEEFAARLARAAKKAGRTLTRGAVGNWERNEGITTENLTLIADVFDLVTLNWLATGRGPAPRKDPIIGGYDPDADERPAALHSDGRINVPKGEIPEVHATLGMGHAEDAETISVPIGGQSVAALRVIDTWKIPERVLRRRLSGSMGHVHIVESLGDSMFPRIHDGDFVFVDTSSRAPSPPGIFALYDGIGQTLKHLELIPNSDPPRVKIIPENPRYDSYERALDEVTIIGRYLCRLTMD